MTADLLLRRRRAVRPLHPLGPEAADRAAAAERATCMHLGIEPELYVVQPFVGARPGPPTSTSSRSSRTGRLRPTAGLRRGGDARRHGLPRPDGEGHAASAASGPSASTTRAATARSSSTSTTRRRCVMADRMTLFRLMAQADRQAGRPHGDLHAQALHRGVGLGRPLQHEPDRRRDRSRTSSATPRTGAAEAGARRPTASPPASCATRRPWPPSARRRSTRTSGCSPGSPTGRCRGRPTWAAYGDNNRSCMLRLPRNRPCHREPGRGLGGQPLPGRGIPAGRRARGRAPRGSTRVTRSRT